MKRSTYREKLKVILNSDKFKKITEEKDEFAIKNEKQVNSSRRQLMKQRNNSDKMYERLGSRSSKPARRYGLAKEHKNDIPLQPVLSIPGSFYENLNKLLESFFPETTGRRH